MSLRSLVVLVGGLAIGLSLADVDHIFFFLGHRSFITHSVLLPVLAYLLIKQPGREWLQIGVVGLSLGMAIHLSFDMFPVGWRGYALIHISFVGYLNSTLSMLWILGNTVACGYLGLVLLKRGEAAITLAAAAVTASLMWGVGASTSIWPLLVLTLAMAVATLLPNRIINGQRVARDVLRRVKTPAL